MSYILNYSKADQHFLGTYVDSTALTASHPSADAGDFAIVQDTDTVWIWDSDTNTWVDSGSTASSSGYVFGVDTGTQNAIVVTPPTPMPSLTNGLPVSFSLANTTTSITPTLNIGGTGAIAIKKSAADSVFPYDMLAGKVYNCVYNSVGTPFWQILNPESQMTNATGNISALVPSQYATIDEAYSAYKRIVSSRNIGSGGSFIIMFDAPGIYDVASQLSALPGVPLSISATGAASPSSSTNTTNLVAVAGTATVTLASAPPTTAVVGGTISFPQGWTIQNLGNYEITNISGNDITFSTPRMDSVSEVGGGTKQVRFYPTVMRLAAPATTMFQASGGCRVTTSINVSYRGRSASVDNGDIWLLGTSSGTILAAGMVHCFKTGIRGTSGASIETTSDLSITASLNSPLSIDNGARYINTSTASTIAYPKFIGSGAINLSIDASAFISQPVIYSATTNGISLDFNSKFSVVSTTRIIQNIAAARKSIFNSTSISAPTSSYTASEGAKINIPTAQGTSNIPFNITQSDGSFIGSAEMGGKIRLSTTSEVLSLKAESIAINSTDPQAVSLPALTSDVAVRFKIKNIGIGTVVVSAADGKLIDGSPSIVLAEMQYATIEALGGTQWIIV